MLTNVVVGGPAVEAEVTESRDLRTFAAVFEEQRPRALRLAYAMTGDASLAEDVVAEAFARTYRQWLKGAVRDADSYVRRAVVNEVRGTWRRLAVRRAHAARERRVEPTTNFGDDQIADADLLQKALATLPPRVRAVVVLRVVEDLSEQQTAEALGLSVGSVKGYLSRGRERLRTALGDTEGASNA
ncbi:MAG TPA: sigma-70 family RNA polymerase sigma factor [Acidimicrobiia bacterium]|nr:sigma-70 family RNA polymerase sigma factor [Acidimicrobiia bacterium]